MGVIAARAFARHRVRRLPFVGATRQAMAMRGRREPGMHGEGAAQPHDFYAWQIHGRQPGGAD